MPQDQAKKSSRIRRGCFGCLGIIIILALPGWYFCLHTTPLKISKETTYVLGPKTADGKRIDYFLAMEERYYPPEMKTDDNGYRLIVRALGIHSQRPKPEHYRQQICEKLGLDPNIKITHKLESPSVILEQYDEEHPVEKDSDKMWSKFQEASKWTLDDYPMLKDWLEENNAGLDLLGEAVRKPVFRIPFYRENESTPFCQSLLSFAEVHVFRLWAQAVVARAKYRIGTGNIDGAVDDILTAHYLARHTGKHGTGLTWILGLIIESNARSIGIVSNPDVPPTKAQIERLITEIDALPPHSTWSELIESDRLYSLASFQDLYWGISSFEEVYYAPSAPSFHSPNMIRSLDLNIALKTLNEVFDTLLSFHDNLDFDEEIFIPKVLHSDQLPIFFTHSRTNTVVDSLICFVVQALPSSRETAHLLTCSANIQRLTLALLLYEKEHGKLPEEDWREAIKPYLGKNPEQYFRCPARKLAEGETAYAMIEGVSSLSASPDQILIVEVLQPLKLGEGNGRIPLEQAVFVKGDKKSTQGLGSHSNLIVVGKRSGAVNTLSESVDPEALQKMLDGTALP